MKQESPLTMPPLIGRLLAPPVFAGDEDKTRRASLLNAILVIFLAYFSLLLPFYWFGGSALPRINPLDLAIYLRLWPVMLGLRRGKVTSMGIAMILLTFIWVTLINIAQGTMRTPVTAAYLFLVILAGAIFDWRGAVSVILASSLAIFGLILAENAGLLPKPDYTVTIFQWFTYTGLLVITGGFSFYNSRITRILLERAQNEIAENFCTKATSTRPRSPC
jgi:hypothetical protein